MFQFRYVFTTVQKRSANLWEIFSKGELIFLQFIEIFTFLRLCLHKKKVVKSHDFRFIMQLHENFDYTVVWTAIDSIAENLFFFFLQPLAIKSKTSAYMEHLLQNVVDFALITKAFM